MTDKVTLEIQGCEDCPHMKKEQDFSGDSFSLEYVLRCKERGGVIIGYWDWHDKHMPIPQWCPLRAND